MTPQNSDPTVYNEMYRHDDRTFDDPARSPYLPMFRAVVGEGHRQGIQNVLEVGCGSGTLARMLIDTLGLQYSGFDIAEEGISKARNLNPPPAKLFVGDATNPSAYQSDYDSVVCVEVLEHIPDDREVIKQWRTGTYCICSVPNFDYPTHVRKFCSEAEVLGRYGDLIHIDRVVRIRKRIWSGGLTLSQYFRRIRWNLDNPRYVAGLLGINSFTNYGGWFLFSGRRN
jgi:SAM-dependent methyltransferase